MSKIDLKSFAAALPQAWRSSIVGQPGGANLKVVRMDGSAYPEEVHAPDSADTLIIVDAGIDDRVGLVD